MADFADIADELNEQHLEDSLRRQREYAARHNALLGAFTGKCLNCGDEISHGRFCETDSEDEKVYGSCRKDWELRNRHFNYTHVGSTPPTADEDLFDDPELINLGDNI